MANASEKSAEVRTSLPEMAAAGADIISDVIGGLPPMPPQIKRSFLKASSALVTGAADWGAAFFEAKAEGIRMETEARRYAWLGAGRAAALAIDADPELGLRAAHFFAGKAVGEQRNRERVLQYAADDLRENPAQEDAQSEIDADFLTLLSDVAAKKSSEDVQEILGRIIAGEIRQPGTFSPATALFLMTVTPHVGRLFQSACNISSVLGSHVGIIVDPFGEPGRNDFAPYGLNFLSLTELQSAGILGHDLHTWVGEIRLEPQIVQELEFAGKNIEQFPNGLNH